MLSLQLFTLLVRIVTVMVCWCILMGVPLLFFTPPLDASNTKPFLGLFYALLLGTGTIVSRSWGGRGLVLMAFPFVLGFTMLGGKAVLDGQPGGALNFLAIYAVAYLAWRLGRALPSKARDEGTLL